MFLMEHEMPNGAVARFHRAIRFEVHADETHAVVNSYHREAMEMISWQDTYTIPGVVRIASLADVEQILTAPGAPFAGGQIIDAIAGDLTALRVRLRTEVSNRAEAVRCQYLTPGSGQAITYTRKEAEARGWSPGADPASAPFLAAEAAATGSTIEELAATVIAQADAWVTIGSAIEARRRALLVALDEATTAEAIAAIDITSGWPGAPA